MTAASTSAPIMPSPRGAPRNGVLTAVEDFVAESDGRFQLTSLTGLHGLGIVVARGPARVQ